MKDATTDAKLMRIIRVLKQCDRTDRDMILAALAALYPPPAKVGVA